MEPKVHKPDRWWLELDNLNTAVRFVLSKENDSETLSENLMFKVHNYVAFDIVECPGQYRDGYVETLGSVIYAPPDSIPTKVSALINFVNNTLSSLGKPNNENRIRAICLGAFFLSEFLLIHPFFDGNGRTARLLLSYILQSHTVVPLSLFIKNSVHSHSSEGTESGFKVPKSRSAYLRALEAEGRTTVPWAVIDYVIQCAVEQCRTSVWLS